MPISNLSNGLRTGVCTSTNRPTTPYEGQVIYETDTDLVYLWNGSAWVEIVSALTKAPRGIVALATSTTNYTATTTVTISTGMTVTFTAVANRYYRITYYEPQVRAPAIAGFYTYARIHKTNAVGTQLNAAINYSTSTTGAIGSLNCVAVTTLTAGSQTIVGASYVNSGTISLDRGADFPATLLVEDIGAV